MVATKTSTMVAKLTWWGWLQVLTWHSSMKLLLLVSMESPVPMRVSRQLKGHSAMNSAGTKQPACAITTRRATCLHPGVHVFAHPYVLVRAGVCASTCVCWLLTGVFAFTMQSGRACAWCAPLLHLSAHLS